jgi:uncharacterized protein YpuA (DUF1002 family)
MGRLKLNFLEQPIDLSQLNPIEAILHEYGQEIYQYAKGYFNYVVSTSSWNDEIKEASLYIIVPEIGYDYKILSIEYKDIENVTTHFYTLKTEQNEIDHISIKNDWVDVHNRLTELLNTTLANKTFKFLVDQVKLKREYKDEE